MFDIGTDILEISRFQETLTKHGRAFLDKVFTQTEQTYCEKFSRTTPHYAVRFAAKEAVAKALGTGFGEFLGFLDIEVVNEPSGKPLIQLSSKAADHFRHPKISLSLSHSDNYALAVVFISR